LRELGRCEYSRVSDEEALEAFKLLNSIEGILPALESSHAIAWGIKHIPSMPEDNIVIINLSGRGDKDLDQVLQRIND
jgi:tryptophan synthase beta subunit